MNSPELTSVDGTSDDEMEGTPHLGHEIVGDLKALATEVAVVAGKAARGKDLGGDLATLQAQYEVTRAHVGEFYQKTRTSAEHHVREVDGAVRAHPYQTMAVAAGIGFLTACVLARPRR